MEDLAYFAFLDVVCDTFPLFNRTLVYLEQKYSWLPYVHFRDIHEIYERGIFETCLLGHHVDCWSTRDHFKMKYEYGFEKKVFELSIFQELSAYSFVIFEIICDVRYCICTRRLRLLRVINRFWYKYGGTGGISITSMHWFLQCPRHSNWYRTNQNYCEV